MSKEKRKPLSKKTRFEVFKRDGFSCQYCGSHPPKAILHVDHITPVALGGRNNIDNLVTSCDQCNLGKSATPLSSIPQSLKDKAADIAEREAQIKGYCAILEEKQARIEDDAWDVANLYIEHFRDDGIRKDYFRSIKMFIERLSKPEVMDSMELALIRKSYNKKQSFLYFCGVCWRLVREQSNA